jgi:hypothetical protein
VEGAPPGPVTLTGPPRAIRGQLRLGNDGNDRVAVRGFAVRAKSLELSQGRGSLRARLEPGVSSDLDATLSLARTTPPGDYQVRLDFDGHEVEALVRVDADPSLQVTPSMVLAGPGETSVRLEVTNTGNVILGLPTVARSQLFADAEVSPPLFGGGATGTPSDLDAVLHLKGSLSLAPGASEQLDITIDVPAGLDPERRYVARLPLSTATLRVVVAPSGKTSAPKRRTTATARRNHATGS